MLKNAPESQCERKKDGPSFLPPQLTSALDGSSGTHEFVEIVHGVAVPTAHWQIVPKGVACPRGCEYHMCMSSGVNMVRLLQSGAKSGGRLADSSTALCVINAPREKLAQKLDQQRQRHLELQLKRHPQPMGGHIHEEPAQRLGEQTSVLQHLQAKSHLQSYGLSSSGALAKVDALENKQRMRLDDSGSSKLQIVDREHKQRRVDTTRDGLRKEATVAEKSRTLIRKGNEGRGVSRTTSRWEESVQQLHDGRTVVTETITLKKVTVLD